jgi:hypothetical protein
MSRTFSKVSGYSTCVMHFIVKSMLRGDPRKSKRDRDKSGSHSLPQIMMSYSMITNQKERVLVSNISIRRLRMACPSTQRI